MGKLHILTCRGHSILHAFLLLHPVRCRHAYILGRYERPYALPQALVLNGLLFSFKDTPASAGFFYLLTFGWVSLIIFFIMYELMVESKFAAAHQLRGYQGKCEKLHGHNWRVTMAVTAERLDDQGLAIDFHDLKKALREVLDQLEHTFLNDIFPFTQINPSSENLAKWIYDNMAKKINDENLEVASVTVWESDTASASYFE